MSPAKAEASRTLTGIVLATGGWAAFSLQDAIVKWLVVKLPVPEVLFGRSVVIVALASFAAQRADLRAMLERRNFTAIGSRAALIFLAWIAYYTAFRSLQFRGAGWRRWPALPASSSPPIFPPPPIFGPLC